jgi:arylsulfatase A-like enzyme
VEKPWTEQQKNYAAQITRLDTDVGQLLDLLKELKIDEKTLVMLSGDNGSSFAAESEMGKLFDQANNGLRGFKRSLYEGALRQAALARWPGVVPAGRVCEDPWAFWDFMPTVAELAETKLPDSFKTDGLSLVSMLKGGPAPARPFFYWELHEGQPKQAARFGEWKIVRPGPKKPLELYNLSKDPGESQNVAATHPAELAKGEKILAESHTPDENWPLDGPRAKRKPKANK